MTVSNYEIMRNRMRGEFVKYDQEKMIEKFKLDFDEAYLYLSFVCRDYRINRKNGIVEWSEDGFQSVTEGDYNESMTIYDVLCYSKEDCHLSGKFVPLYSAKGMAKGLHAADGSRMFQKTADSFQGHLGQLEAVCRSLGEPAGMSGDVAAVLRVFPFLPATFQFWEGDEEFPPSMKFMFDENILDYMHFETVYFMMSHILERMGEMLSIEVKNKKTAGYIRKTFNGHPE